MSDDGDAPPCDLLYYLVAPLPRLPLRGTEVKLRFRLKRPSVCVDSGGQLGRVCTDFGLNSLVSLDLAVYATVVLTLLVAAELRQDFIVTATAADP